MVYPGQLRRIVTGYALPPNVGVSLQEEDCNLVVESSLPFPIQWGMGWYYRMVLLLRRFLPVLSHRSLIRIK